jgi:hypothetical protein
MFFFYFKKILKNLAKVSRIWKRNPLLFPHCQFSQLSYQKKRKKEKKDIFLVIQKIENNQYY